MTIPITRPWFDQDELAAVGKALNSGWVAQGFKVTEFECLIAQHEDVKYGIATSSCTTALHLAMVAQGMHEGMDVLIPAFTFVATANAVVETGATPILVDIDTDTFNISIAEVRSVIINNYKEIDGELVNIKTGNALWGIVPVHQFGLCCNIEEINKIAKEYNLTVIEDAACALGASYRGIHPGGFGNTACVSFHPRKSITTGEGGMILSDDKKLTERLRGLRSHGCTISADERDKNRGFLLPEYDEFGFNYRMTDIQGAIGIAQVGKLDMILKKRRKLANRYNELIKCYLPNLIIPIEPLDYFHTYQSYVCMLRVNDNDDFDVIDEVGKLRNRVMSALEDCGVSTRQGTHAIHVLECYRNKYQYSEHDFPNAFKSDRLSISLPLYVGMTEEEQKYVIDSLKGAINNA